MSHRRIGRFTPTFSGQSSQTDRARERCSTGTADPGWDEEKPRIRRAGFAFPSGPPPMATFDFYGGTNYPFPLASVRSFAAKSGSLYAPTLPFLVFF